MLSEAKHLSHYFSPLSFLLLGSLSFRPSLPFGHPTVIPTERPTVISTERSEWRNLYVVRGTVVGIYDLRRLQLRRCGELDPEGLSSRLAVAFLLPEMLYFYVHVMHCLLIV